MHPTENPQPPRTPRRDGWTPARRRQFLDHLAAGLDVRRTCARVGLSRESAYRLRRREAGFARAWDAAQGSARAAAEERFLALLAERLPGIMAAVSGALELRRPGQTPGRASTFDRECELHTPGISAQDTVTSITRVSPSPAPAAEVVTAPERPVKAPWPGPLARALPAARVFD